MRWLNMRKNLAFRFMIEWEKPFHCGEEGSLESLSLSQIHEAVLHDNWFRKQVGAAIAEADSSEAQWVSNEEANRLWAEKRAELEKQLTRRTV